MQKQTSEHQHHALVKGTQGGTPKGVPLNSNYQVNVKREIKYFLVMKLFDRLTERLVNYILDREHIYTLRDDLKSEIFIYRDGIYTPKGKSYIREICRALLGKAYTEHRVSPVINKIIVDTFVNSEDFFRDTCLNEVCVQNGILNLETREVYPFTPNKIFFNKLPIFYDPKAKCEKIKSFLREVLKHKDDLQVFFELAGFGLYREYFIERAFMLVGDGRNGKSKTLELLKRFVGVQNTCSVHLNAMQYRTSAICELHNRLFNLGGDLSSDALREVGMFKQLSGRDVVQVPRKYLRDLIFQNYAKHVYACNELPRVYDKSLGFWSRWVLLEFPYTFLTKQEYEKSSDKKGLKIRNPNIINKICEPAELSGMLNEALDGLERLRKNKDFSYSRGSAEVKDFWVRKSDSFMAFCLDCLEEDFEGEIPKDTLRKAYLKYRKKYKLIGQSDVSIKITLQELFGADDQQKPVYEYLDVHNKKFVGNKRVWKGIKFKGRLDNGSANTN